MEVIRLVQGFNCKCNTQVFNAPTDSEGGNDGEYPGTIRHPELVAADEASISDVFHNGQIILAGIATVSEYFVFRRFLPYPCRFRVLAPEVDLRQLEV